MRARVNGLLSLNPAASTYLATFSLLNGAIRCQSDKSSIVRWRGRSKTATRPTRRVHGQRPHESTFPAGEGNVGKGELVACQLPNRPTPKSMTPANDPTRNLSGLHRRQTAAFDAMNPPPPRSQEPECEFDPAIVISIGVGSILRQAAKNLMSGRTPLATTGNEK